MRAQIGGDWKWWRFVFGGLIILLIDLFAFVPFVRAQLTHPVQLLQPGISQTDAEIYAFSFLILLWVAVMEVWHYLIRLRTQFWLEHLGEVNNRYALQPRRTGHG